MDEHATEVTSILNGILERKVMTQDELQHMLDMYQAHKTNDDTAPDKGGYIAVDPEAYIKLILSQHKQLIEAYGITYDKMVKQSTWDPHLGTQKLATKTGNSITNYKS